MVFLWLAAVRKSKDEIVVLDRPHDLIKAEYSRNLNKEDYGRMVIAEKLPRGQCRWVEMEPDDNGHAMILHDAGEEVKDREDRKMVAAALESGASIVNASDTDWCELEHCGTLGRLGIKVTHLLHELCQGWWERKRKA